ncbi:hypothetical protein [Streptomyces sp. NPDC050560]|uniref:hypothetical protein n=1 Tax=Streptomyces sp. NPDC050560 TaxID=3365630 RepID=UPI00379B6893
MALFLMASMAGCSGGDFAHQFHGVEVDVPLDEALKTHQVSLPEKSRDIHYSANSKLEGYPFLLTFEIPCRVRDEFLGSNHLRVSTEDRLKGSSAAMEASREGLPPGSRTAWFRRAGADGRSEFEAIVASDGAGSACQVWANSMREDPS